MPWHGQVLDTNRISLCPGLNKSLFSLSYLSSSCLVVPRLLKTTAANKWKEVKLTVNFYTQPTIQRLPGSLSLKVKQPRREADHALPLSAEIKNEWSSSSMAVIRTASLFAIVHRTKSKEI